MARATVVPTAAKSTSKATLERTRPRKVMLSSLPKRTSYARSATVVVASELDTGLAAVASRAAAAGIGGRGLGEGSASCRCRTCAGGGPRRTTAEAAA